MRADLERINLLFKTKNINNPQAVAVARGRDEWDNKVKGGRMHNKEAEVVDLVGEHLQTFFFKKGGEGRRGSPPPLQFYFLNLDQTHNI